jgi:hypothetical protein
MAKPKKGQKHPPKKKSKEKAEKKQFTLPSIVKNFLILGGVLLLLNTLKEQNKGYKWVAETLVAKTPEQLEKYKDLTYDQKMEGKLGFAYKYFKFINENTPEDAIILFPPDTMIRPKGQVHHSKKGMNGYSTNSKWVSYFIYPRKVVYEDRKDEYPELYENVTYVAVMNQWGYEKLPYRVRQESQFSVMPMELPQQAEQQQSQPNQEQQSQPK